MQAIYVIDSKDNLFAAQSAQVAILMVALRSVFMQPINANLHLLTCKPVHPPLGKRQFMLKFAAIPFSLFLYQDIKNLSHKQNNFLSQHNKSNS
ncbi:hypothetical protein [Herminiimonas aquatilis]|uniref:Uncharacterized protein n=1 Tax=Herminiimonas aquatilis TaxID=345342 RepID=A0ABW2J6R6_9BURK